MKKPNRSNWKTLAAAWDAYGHSIPWENLIDIKYASHVGANGGFVAVAWNEDGEVNYATLSRVGSEWIMQDDCHESVTRKKWGTARIPSECDWLVFPMRP